MAAFEFFSDGNGLIEQFAGDQCAEVFGVFQVVYAD